MLIEIKGRFSGRVLFSHDIENNTIGLTLAAAITAKIDLSYSDLRGSDLSYSDLSYSNLRGSDLSYSDLSYSDLSNSDLRGSDLSYSDLSNSDLRGSDLSYSDLSYSNLRGSNLRGSDLSNSDLSNSDLSYSDLRGSGLSYSDLRGSNLSNSDLRGSGLSYSDLRGSNLRGSDLRGSDLSNSDLSNSDLSNSDLRGSNLHRGKNAALVQASTLITPEGSFIGWKKCNDNVIVKLRMPDDTKRSNATGRKCRAEFVDVLEVFGADVGITNAHGPSTEYRVGARVHCDKWDDNRWNECSGGIHFFLTREEAEAW